MFVYKITNKANGKAYVGITTKKVKRRMLCHRVDAKRGSPTAIARAIRKHGWESFVVEVLYEASSKAELLVCERALIAAHGTMSPRGYNLTSGGDGCNDRQVSASERVAMSERAKKQHADGRFPQRSNDWRPSEETRAKMSAARKGKKIHLSQETRRLMGERHRGDNNIMRRSPEIVRLVAEKRRGVKRTPEQRRRIAVGRRAASGTKLSYEIACQIRYLVSLGATHTMAAKTYGVSRSMVTLICLGERYSVPD